jgi:hypothetical protein
MIDFLRKSCEGQLIGRIWAVYFQPLNEERTIALSLVVCSEQGEWSQIGSTNDGKIRLTLLKTDSIFADSQIGFSFIAPLMIDFNDKLSGSEKIAKVQYSEFEEFSRLSLTLDSKQSLFFDFMDDTMVTSFNAAIV